LWVPRPESISLLDKVFSDDLVVREEPVRSVL
jgi:hypothetical protein